MWSYLAGAVAGTEQGLGIPAHDQFETGWYADKELSLLTPMRGRIFLGKTRKN